MRRRASPLAVLAVLAVILAGVTPAGAGDTLVSTDGLFESATKALHDGRAAEAINSLEALADRGVVDPVASYDCGLAYAMRVRIGAEVPGDLGRAAHGFEEARDLSRDARLIDDASHALAVVRSEVARRRMRADQPLEVDAGRSLPRTLSALLPEDRWALLAAASSAMLAMGLFARWLARARRTRVAGGVAAGVAVPALLLAGAMTLVARHDRQSVREAIVVAPNARPSDERGISPPGATPLPEGARVELVEARGPWTRIRFGSSEARVPVSALRELARPPN